MGSPMNGVVMVRLSDEDGRAVDILLDRTRPAAPASKQDGNGNGGQAAPAGGAPAFPVASDQLAARLDVCSSLLHTLGQMPAADPPENLIERTLAYIEARGELGRTPAPAGTTDRPSAGPVV
jgi:hypothetical protein